MNCSTQSYEKKSQTQNYEKGQKLWEKKINHKMKIWNYKRKSESQNYKKGQELRQKKGQELWDINSKWSKKSEMTRKNIRITNSKLTSQLKITRKKSDSQDINSKLWKNSKIVKKNHKI